MRTGAQLRQYPVTDRLALGPKRWRIWPDAELPVENIRDASIRHEVPRPVWPLNGR